MERNVSRSWWFSKKGLFFILIKFPFNYPESPPDIIFRNPIYHINVHPFKPEKDGDVNLGYVYLNILKSWKPENTIKEAILQLFDLLSKPNPDNAYGSEILDEFEKDYAAYMTKAKYSTKKYANPRLGIKNLDFWDFDPDTLNKI